MPWHVGSGSDKPMSEQCSWGLNSSGRWRGHDPRATDFGSMESKD